jgi:DNA invertase Pin-like site-specific DNA recombinase
VPSLDRLGRSIQDLITIVAGLRRRGIGFTLLHEALDTTTPGGRLIFHVFAALAEFIRELIVEGTNEGLAAARARGARLSRPPAMTPEQIRHARVLRLQDTPFSAEDSVPLTGFWHTYRERNDAPGQSSAVITGHARRIAPVLTRVRRS